MCALNHMNFVSLCHLNNDNNNNVKWNGVAFSKKKFDLVQFFSDGKLTSLLSNL